MRHKVLLFCALLSLFPINNGLASTAYYEVSLPKWLGMMKSGNDREKKLALHNLFFLYYAEYRKDIKVFDPILEALKDKDPSIREAAAACLKRIGEGIQRSVDDKVWSQNCCKNTAIVPFLIKALKDDKPRVRAEAAKALGMYRSDRKDRYIVDKEERGIEPLIEALKDKDPWVRLNAAFSLGQLKAHKAIEPLTVLLEDDSDWRNKFVQQEAITTIRKIGVVDNKTTSLLIQKSEDQYLRAEIIETLATFPSTAAKEVLLKASNDPNERVRKSALKALSRLPVMYDDRQNYENKKNEILEKSLKDPSAQIRLDAINNLVSYDKSMIPLLSDALTDSSDEVKLKAIEALGKIIDEQIPLTMISFIESNGNTNLISKANETFRKWVERYRKKVYIYRKDEKRYVVENRNDVPKGIYVTSKHIDSKIVSKLIEKSNADPSKFLGLLGLFEDESIKSILLKNIESQPTAIKVIAVGMLRTYATNDDVLKIIKLLQYPEAEVRAAAVASLGELRDKRALNGIIEKLDDENRDVRFRALDALSEFDDPRQTELYIKLLKDKDSSIRNNAALYLSRKSDKRAVEELITLLNDPDDSVPRAAARALGKTGDKRALEPLTRALNGQLNKNRTFDGDLRLREAAAEALGSLSDKSAIPALTNVALNQKEDARLRYDAAAAIITISGPAGIEIVKSLLHEEKFYSKIQLIDLMAKADIDAATNIAIDFLNSENNVDVSSAVTLLGKFKNIVAIKPLVKTAAKNKVYPHVIASSLREYQDPDIVNKLITFLGDKDISVKKGAIILLGEFRDNRAVEPLKPFLEDKDLEIRTLVKDALSKIESFTSPQQRMMDGPGPMPLMRGNDTVFRTSTGFRIMRNGAGQPFEKMPRDRKEAKPEIVTAQPVKIVDLQPLIAKLKDKDANVRRDAADVLGDSGNVKASEHLIPILKDNDAYVRQAAARSIGRLKTKDAVSALIDSTKDSDINVRSFSTWALGEIQDVKAIESLANLLLDKEEKIRDQSFDALRKYSDPVARRTMVTKLIESSNSSVSYILLSKLMSLEGDQVLFKALEDPAGNDAKTIRNYIELLERNIVSINDRQLPQKALREHKNRELVLSEISAFIKTKTYNTPYSTINFLGHLKDPKGLPILLDIVNTKREFDSKLAVARAESSIRIAVTALGELGDKGASKTLLDILVNANESFLVRRDAAQALGKIGEEKAVIPLMEILKNSSVEKELRTGAASALGNLKDKKPVELLINILKDDSADLWFRVSAASALVEIGDEKAIEPLSETLKNPKSHSYLIHAVEIALRKFKDKN